jgi:hypothetical protein
MIKAIIIDDEINNQELISNLLKLLCRKHSGGLVAAQLSRIGLSSY